MHKITGKCLSRVILLLGLMINLGCDGSSRSYSASPSGAPASGSSVDSPAGRKGKFTILLASFTFADRITQAQALEQRAKRILQTNDIWFESSPGRIDVNFGSFQTQKEAQRQKEKVRNVYRRLQLGPYQFCYVKEIPQPDPPARPEWNILHNRCSFSLQVGIYYNVPEKNYFRRKADAVRAVERYRKNNDPAYFYHGEHESYVLIGCLHAAPHTSVLQVLRNKYPFSYENGFKVNVGSRLYSATQDLGDQNARIVKTPKNSFLVDIRQLTGAATHQTR